MCRIFRHRVFRLYFCTAKLDSRGQVKQKYNLKTFNIMSNETTRIFVPEGNNDALTAAMLNGGGFGGGMWNNPIWAIVFLAALRNGGIFGNDCNGSHSQLSQIQETLNTNQGNTLLMDAIKGNATAIGQLSQTIGCNQNAVTSAINAVQSAICNVGNQVGMSKSDIVNAINMGNMSITNAVKDCCCQTQQNILKIGYDNQISNLQQSQLIQNGFAQVGYASAEQTCAIKQNATDNTSRVLAKLDQIEDSRKDREIASLTAALTAATSRAERATELAPVYQALNDIKCKQPNTVTVPYQPFVTVPNCVAYNAFGLNGYGLNPNGLWS